MTLQKILQRWRPGYRFHGGVHPPERKILSSEAPITPVPMPKRLVLPLNMHLGAPARPSVNPGDRVRKGQTIALGHGPVSSPVHAPTSGTIVAIGSHRVQHPSGLSAPCITIETDFQDTWVARTPLPDWQSLPASRIIQHIQEAGISGMGGAGFPTSVKISLREHQRIEQLIINAVECEPYITADDRLMRERAQDIVQGIQVLEYLLQPLKTVVAVEDNKPEAIAAMQHAAQGTRIRIRPVPTRYPSGGEKQLIQLLTGKEVRSGSIPAEIGVVCQNVGTAYAIWRAIAHGEPLISRITTLTGEALASPGNYEVLLGTPVADLLATAGVDPHRTGRLIMGGPMMGFTITDTSVPVVKTTNCIIAATNEELPAPPPELPCIRCGACAEVCPVNLLPQQLYWYARSGDLERSQHYNLMDCIECGACAWVCPSHIPLVQYYRHTKGEIRQQARDQEKADRARQRFEARKARLEQEQAEKQARRKARLEANRPGQAKPATATPDKAQLKAASLQASAAYKEAVKALREAESSGADNLEALRDNVTHLKAAADQAKAAVRDAGHTAAKDTQDTSADTTGDLKKAVSEASAAYKQAVRALREAEQTGTADLDTLRADVDRLKAAADQAKAAARDGVTAVARVQPPQTTSTPGLDPQALKRLKTASNMANRQWKEAQAALDRAQRDGMNDHEAIEQVATLKLRADEAKAALANAVSQVRSDPDANDPKTLLERTLARQESAVREKATALAIASENGDDEKARVLQEELAILEQQAADSARQLRMADHKEAKT